MLKVITGIAVACLLASPAFAETGCARSTPSVSKTGDIVKGTAAGAVAGGLLGGLLGNNAKKDGKAGQQGVILGAVVGGAAGALVGNEAGNRRETYVTEAAYLECEITATRAAISVRETTLETTRADVERTEARVVELTALYRQNVIGNSELGAYKAQLETQISGYNQDLMTLRTELDRITRVEAEAREASGERSEELQSRRADLIEARNAAEAQYAALAELRDRASQAYASLPVTG